MKKFIFAVVAVFAFGFSNAQVEEVTDNAFSKGDKFVEGSFSFRSGDIEDSWALTPKMGVMLDDKWAVGGYLAFSGRDNFSENTKYSTLGFGVFARYYFLSLGASKRFNAYGELGLGYSSLSEEPDGGSKQTDSALNANIDLGLNYFFTSNWAATFELANILSYNNVNPDGNEGNSSDLNVNINLFNNIFATPKFGLLYRW
ncbi:MAG TPA: outer membrane beta-barrel protein [Flavobacterium sp.]|nr:outer membrane beta-barrel protein [Flavobacterium sp.]